MFPLFAAGGPIDPLMVLVGALILDAILGDPPWLWRTIPHPVALIGYLIGFLDDKLNRDRRSEVDRRLRGVLVVIGMVLGAAALGLAVTELRRRWFWGWAIEGVLIWMLIAQRSLFGHVASVARALDREGLAGGRRAVAKIVGRDPESLDQFGVARAAIESCAENFSDAVVAPVFWYVLFGFPGMLVYKTVNTMDSMIGHRSEQYLEFGMAAARLDDAMNLLPARLSGVLLSLACLFVPGGHPVTALRVMWRDHGHHRSPNSGWPESAIAGGLDLSLAGPRKYPGYVAQEKWIGDGRARATTMDIRRALMVLAVACLLDVGLVILAVLAQE
ncbi:adenosylcobinamide-phosphate synthase CbiB [Telmatospirillum sp.]|uniref:adenosylcobinamide-phosphate synthase CbiB n=1 Tax=Telmatospirillum sp. TaxID=2079197 RepID=UPI00283D0371|nr:adenosylcobinamide-phosphate synthase CbiB [Telmatospirillum sp.]MDR3437577.1 adenosylcobinamide-phosphate synthase CbiB [Telmatospirillum sp.]